MNGGIENARWNRLQALFAELIERPAAEREAWLRSVEADEDLRREALELAGADDAHARVTGHFGAAVQSAGAAAPRANERLGPYRLLREIGVGGMGAVFLAQRADDEFDNRVAIKLIRGIATREAGERLRHERQILANLNHPHIARLLDGGTTDAGQPYLVMDFVDGVDIAQYCRRRNASLAERLRLMQKVARAVHYAHQRLVIHRDLKPANVLVRPDGEPVLLDFGIAKLLDGSARDAQQTGAPWFTPAYASPEQLRGETVSTASDVYALGLLLYELVTNETPPSPRPDMLRPDTRATGRADRDLARIVAKATHADPERRYAAAEALALDLERYLAGRPIEAAPDRFTYRCRKFVQRHPFSVAISTLALLLALFSVGALVVQRNRALAAEQSASAVRDFLLALFRSADPEATGGDKPDLLAILARGADNAQADTALAPPARAELLGALGTIYLNLGRFKDAEHLLDASTALWQASGSSAPQRYLPRLAHVALLLSTGKTRVAVQDGEALLAELRADSGAPPELLVQVLDKLGEARTVSSMTEPPAETEALEQVALTRRTQAADPLQLGVALDNLAMIQAARDKTVEAEAAAAESVRLLEQAGPGGRYALRAALLTYAATLSRQNRHAEAIALMARSVALTRALYPPGHHFISRSLSSYGNELAVSGRLDEAEAALTESLAIQRAAFGDDNPRMAAALFNLASLRDNQDKPADAAAQLAKALALRVPDYGAGDEHALQIAAALAYVEDRRGDGAAAGERFDAVEKELAQSGVTSRNRARVALRLAHFRLQQGRNDAAGRWSAQALALLNGNAAIDPLLQQDAALLQAETLAAQGRGDAAREAWTQALRLLDAIAPAARYPAYENYLTAVRIALDRGDGAAAARLFADAEHALADVAPMPRLVPLRAQLAARLKALPPRS